MGKTKIVYKRITDFLRGESSKIMRDNSKEDSIVIVNRNSKPQNVIISFERYERMKESGEVDL